MMPVYTCEKCDRVFCGWGVNHLCKSREGLICPDCQGALEAKGSGKNGNEAA